VACRNSAGLFYIVGRAARFVKPFGFRVNLDDIESRFQPAFPGTRCGGDDHHIVVALVGARADECWKLVAKIAADTSLPEFMFRIVELDEIPRLTSGKVDYSRILDRQRTAEAARPAVGIGGVARLILSRQFLRRWMAELQELVGIKPRQWTSVAHIYETLLTSPHADDADTFRTLAGDSLSYVQVIAALTTYIGALPADWPEWSIRDLEALRSAHHAPTV